MIHYWICSECALLNKLEAKSCKQCGLPKETYLALVHFNDEQHRDKWLKVMKENMGAKVWYSP